MTSRTFLHLGKYWIRVCYMPSQTWWFGLLASFWRRDKHSSRLISHSSSPSQPPSYPSFFHIPSMSCSQGHPNPDTSFTQKDLLGLWPCHSPPRETSLPKSACSHLPSPLNEFLQTILQVHIRWNFPHFMDILILISGSSWEDTSSLYPLISFGSCWQPPLCWTAFQISSLFMIILALQKTI